jgi:hypothetical protein
VTATEIQRRFSDAVWKVCSPYPRRSDDAEDVSLAGRDLIYTNQANQRIHWKSTTIRICIFREQERRVTCYCKDTLCLTSLLFEQTLFFKRVLSTDPEAPISTQRTNFQHDASSPLPQRSTPRSIAQLNPCCPDCSPVFSSSEASSSVLVLAP